MRHFAVLTTVVLAIGCQHMSVPAPTTVERLPLSGQTSLDGAPVPRGSMAGRVICIDPGHGDPWPGAVAPSNGLRESDVNLCVAVRVAVALESAGAEVILTRADDPALNPESLSRDLAQRADIANRGKVDAFVSIHHNADIVPDSGRNDLEVYYRLGDEEASLVLGQCLMRALAKDFRVGAPRKLLFPGNYKVLRQAEVPAVLLESSYLTNAENAAFLATEAALDREAEAICEGVRAYFELDPPRTSEAIVRSLDGGERHEVEVCFSRGLPIDPDTVKMSAGERVLKGACVANGRGFAVALRSPLPNGTHQVTLTGSNDRGAGFRCAVPVIVDRPPARIEVTQAPEVASKSMGCEVLFRVKVCDALGFPVADGTEVHLDKVGQPMATVEGEARLYVLDPRGRYRVSAGALGRSFRVRRGPSAVRTMRFVDAKSLKPVQELIVRHDNGFSVGTPEGWVALPRGSETLRVLAPGYPSVVLSDLTWSDTSVELEPVDGGVLLGRIIALDAAFGGRSAGTIDDSGVRACDVNMDIVKLTASHLRNAGARIILTRTEDVGATDLRRLLTVKGRQPEVLVSVSFDASAASTRMLDETGHFQERAAAFAGHYPGSRNGRRLAEAIASRLGSAETLESVTYLVQQTACPAVVVQPGVFTDLTCEEMRGMKQRSAAAIHGALVEYFSK